MHHIGTVALRIGSAAALVGVLAAIVGFALACDEQPRDGDSDAITTSPALRQPASPETNPQQRPSAAPQPSPEPPEPQVPAVARRVQALDVDTDQWLFEALVPLDSHPPEMIFAGHGLAGTYISTLPVEGLGQLRLTLDAPPNPGQAFAATLTTSGGSNAFRKIGWGAVLSLPGQTALVLQLADEADPPLPPELHFKAGVALEPGPPASFAGVLRFPTDPKYLSIEFARED